MKLDKAIWFLAGFCWLLAALSTVWGQNVPQIITTGTKTEKLKVGDKMIPFSLTDLEGSEYAYQTGNKRVLVILFLTALQDQTDRTMADVKSILPQIRQQGQPLDVIGVIIKENSKDYFRERFKELGISFPILLDTEFHLWGKLGIIAAPTTIIVSKDDIITWRKAGYGYNYTPALRDQVSLAIGLIDK